MTARLTKTQRQHKISRLLVDHSVTSQPQLLDLLAAEGVDATQATVSRDLDELGAVKVRIPGGGLIYGIPEMPMDRHVPEDTLRRVLGEYVADVAHSANLVVLRTPPGSAHVVASALDRTGLKGVMGTVAGDDTVIVVVAEQIGGNQIAKQIRQFAGL